MAGFFYAILVLEHPQSTCKYWSKLYLDLTSKNPNRLQRLGFFICTPTKTRRTTLSKYSKDKFILHPKEGLKMEGLVTPFLRFCIGIAILLVAIGITLLFSTPFINAVRWW